MDETTALPQPDEARGETAPKHPGNDALAPEDAWETRCPKREDGWHCGHWYDGQPCCACGDDEGPVDGE